FTVQTSEERNSRSCLLSSATFPRKASGYNYSYERNPNIPKDVDWRDSKCVNPAKNQGMYCGSCWAFATVGVLESLYCLKTGELLDLSEQQLVDCDNRDEGCCGGFPLYAMEYLAHHSLMLSKNYEYSEKKHACQYDSDEAIQLNATKYYILPDEYTMASGIAQDGPVAVGIGVTEEFMLYNGGIYDGSCAPSANHAVIIVGYGTLHCNDSDDDGEDYWIIKNSWGDSWGEDGFGKIKRNVDKCSITAMVTTMELK
ncbi:hypothetical protein GDO86_018017, partial [Hymenochirus boettgeri]